MIKNFKLVFDEVMIRQLKKLATNEGIKNILTHIFDRLEENGPNVGKLLDMRLRIYEVKLKRPPIRLYYRHNIQTNEIYVFEYGMKTSDQKQERVIDKIKEKSESQFFS